MSPVAFCSYPAGSAQIAAHSLLVKEVNTGLRVPSRQINFQSLLRGTYYKNRKQFEGQALLISSRDKHEFDRIDPSPREDDPVYVGIVFSKPRARERG